MNEQRQQAYLQLVQDLLTCETGQEVEILAGQQELVDEGLVMTALALAKMLAEQEGQEAASTVEWLVGFARNLATQLGIELGSMEGPGEISKDSEGQLRFLLDVLQSVSDSHGDAQVVYSLLRQNLQFLNDGLVGLLRAWVDHTFAEVEQDAQRAIAMVIGNFGNLIQEFPLGNKAVNMDLSIAGYEILLGVFTATTDPEVWSQIQNNRASTYLNRIKGDRGENLEKAIAGYEAALEVRTKENFPIDWAMTQNNRANAYSERIKGDRGENLEKAIAGYEAALEIYTKENFSIDWAMTQNNRANAYSERIKGDRGGNLEMAIAGYEAALEIYTKENFPIDWAMTQNNHANAYNQRIKGDRGENLELSIACYEAALEVRTKKDLPIQWATTQDNLANAYLNRIRGDRGENLEKAIACYEAALEVRTKKDLPIQWATTQNNLANAYLNRIKGDRGENLELSIACYEAALEVRTKKDLPIDWAMTQNNLATAYSDRIRGARGENLELSIACYEAALEVYTKKDLPIQWATTQNNLANSYLNRIRGNRGENLKLSIACYEAALEVRTPSTLPIDCLQTARNLGNAHFTQGDWQKAIDSYDLAIQAAETSRNWAVDEDERQRIIREALSVYENTIQAQINLGQIDAAIVTSERARSRQLVDFMATNDLYSNAEIPCEVQESLREHAQLHQAIQHIMDSKPENEKLADINSLTDLQLVSAKIRELESQKQQVWKKIRQLDPTIANQLQVNTIDLATIQSLVVQGNTAILSFYTTDDDTHIFIIRPHQEPQIHTCFGQGWATLQQWLAETWLAAYTTNRLEWLPLIPQILAELADRLKIQELIEQLQDIQELVLIPHLYLHQIPFSALPIPNSQELLGDKFTIRYAPSCQILRYCVDRPQDEVVRHGIIENADGTLPGTVYECQGIAALFNVESSCYLQGWRQSTLAQFQSIAHSVTDLHVSSHAFSRLDSPLETSLKFADGSLTLSYILINRYPQLQEVFLSCCETHLGATTITDDLLTLGTGFLCAGARTVLSSLWAVDDIATALFCRLYYQNRCFGDNRSRALQKAQTSLRFMSGEEFQHNHSQDLKTHLTAYVKENKADRRALKIQKDQGEIEPAVFEIQDSRLSLAYNKAIELRGLPGQAGAIDLLCKAPRPFEHPYYWAGFICQGLS